MTLYTGRGDYGNTNIIGGRTVKKNDALVEAYGTLDELNAVVGIVISLLKKENSQAIKEELNTIQITLFDCGTVLCDVDQQMAITVSKEQVTWLEKSIDGYEAQTPSITKFILPGGSQVAASLQLARTVTRRAERCIVSLMEEREIPADLYIFINRLSDYFFALARYVNTLDGIPETFYENVGDVFHND